ncbi:plasmid replication protein RepC [Brucella tritici]|uniref:Replication protein C n=1 Tax=Brucella tritici TaxID=94626 RepID=A0A6L3YMZ9_9HYPH|nr:plasmid replication protein RepC [Brucella tritici]KAB2684415.1 replication protein C [Brucella tritici]
MSTNEVFALGDRLKPVAGVRRITPAGLSAQRAAREYAGNRTLVVKRIEALQVAKRAAAALGLKAAKIAMIDKLFGYSPAADWNSRDANPIVWPSNRVLAQQLGLSVSTARHHLRGLTAAGLIAHASHPTFQRRGVRDGEGNIVEAFGIDLSPIITRYHELLEIALAYEREGRERRSLAYRRTQIRREIEAILVAAQLDRLTGSWQHFHARLDRLREYVPGDLEQFRALIEALTALREDVEQAYAGASEHSNLDTAVASFSRVQTTADLPSVEDSRRAPAVGSRQVASALQRRPLLTSEREMKGAPSAARTDLTTELNQANDIGNISLALVRAACPALQKHCPDVFENWTALCSSGPRLCVAATINTQVWTEAENHLGSDTAIAALAVTVQRAEDGQVTNPGAYLRTLVQRGLKGQLRISRSLFALADARAERLPKQPSPPAPSYRGFPIGPINWTAWAELVREHAPKPTPDIEIVAGAFRSWCRKGNIDLAQPIIEKAFIGFCKKWRPR